MRTKMYCLSLLATLFVSLFNLQAAGRREDAYSQDLMLFMSEYYSVEKELFLYQDYFQKNPALLNSLYEQAHSQTEAMIKELSLLIDNEFGSKFEKLSTMVDLLSDNHDKEYALALLSFMQYKIEFEQKKNKRTALTFLEKADSHIQEALRSRKNHADFFRLHGEIQNQFILLRGGATAIFYSMESKKSYERALALNNQHAKSMLLLGVWYLFAPDIAGGSMQRSLAFIRKARNEAKDEYTLFLTFIWESLALSKAKNRAEAIDIVNKALQIAPNNTWANWILQELQAGKLPLDAMM